MSPPLPALIGAHATVATARDERPAALQTRPRLELHPTRRVELRHVLRPLLAPTTSSNSRDRTVSTETPQRSQGARA
jgi:hypothetical protein